MIARYPGYQEIAQGLFIFSSSRSWREGSVGGVLLRNQPLQIRSQR